MTGRPPKPTLERFWNNVTKTETGCWLYGKRQVSEHYGLLNITRSEQEQWSGRECIGAHQFSYSIHKGPIPKGKWVCHSCDVRRCVNPDHLWVGTQKENLDDMRRKGRERFLKGKDNPMFWRRGALNHMFGKTNKHSDESKRKMSAARTGRKLTQEHKNSISRGLREHYRV